MFYFRLFLFSSGQALTPPLVAGPLKKDRFFCSFPYEGGIRVKCTGLRSPDPTCSQRWKLFISILQIKNIALSVN